MPVHSRVLLVMLLLSSVNGFAQNLEPRRWSHLPVDVNFLGVGSAYTWGDILFDPALNVEDATLEMGGFGVGYIRTFDFFGKSARLDVTIPFAKGKWEGLLNGVDAVVRRQGLSDPSMRFSINLYGAPALKAKEYFQYRAQHRVNTVVGVSLGVLIPVGEYSRDLLINLGGNRWVLRPQFGVLHERNKWQFETTMSAFVFQKNNEFVAGTREQDPLWFIQGHVMYTFKPGLWAGVGAGYGYGGRSTINGVRKEDDSRLSYWAVSVGLPINPMQGLKLSFVSSRTNTSSDSDLDSITLDWSLMFGL